MSSPVTELRLRQLGLPARLIAVAALIPLALTACGGQGDQRAATPTAHPSAAEEPSTGADQSVAASQAASAAPRQTAQDGDPSPESTDVDEAMAEANREADEQRAAAAASGEPVAPRDTHIPAPGEYGFGKPAATAQHGEVVAYTPRHESGRLTVPITIHNGSDDRVNYRVEVTVVGGNQDSPVTVTTNANNVFPGTTWPTQVDITTAGVTTSPANLQIRLEVVQDVYPYGDGH